MLKKIGSTCPSCGAEFSTEVELPEPEADEAQLKESQGKVALLEGQVAELQEKATLYDGLNNLTGTPKGIIDLADHFAKRLGYEGFWDLAYKQGKPEAEVAEHGGEPEPTIVKGRKDEPGWRYLPGIDMSIKEEKEGE